MRKLLSFGVLALAFVLRLVLVLGGLGFAAVFAVALLVGGIYLIATGHPTDGYLAGGGPNYEGLRDL